MVLLLNATGCHGSIPQPDRMVMVRPWARQDGRGSTSEPDRMAMVLLLTRQDGHDSIANATG